MALSLNRVTIIGHLGGDPERRGSDGAVVACRVATNEGYRDKETGEWVDRAEWHNVVVFGGGGQYLANKGKKGDLVLIEGKLKTRKWEKEPGNAIYFTEIVVQPYGDSVQLMSKDGSTPSGGADKEARNSRMSTKASEDRGRQMSREIDDEIPF